MTDQKEGLALGHKSKSELLAMGGTKKGRDAMWSHVCDLVYAIEASAPKSELGEMASAFYEWFDRANQMSQTYGK